MKEKPILIVDSLNCEKEGNLNNLNVKKDFLNYENWTENEEAIIILSNSIRKNNLQIVSLLVSKLMKKYKDLNNVGISMQRRIATVGINYLYNLRLIDKKRNKTVSLILNWLSSLSNNPELCLIRELKIYFTAIYGNDIKKVLNLSGFEVVSERLLN